MQSLTAKDVISILLKRKWWILLSVVVWMPLAVGIWNVFPKIYKSTVVVTIDSPKVSKDYVKGLGGDGRGHEDPEFAAMQQLILSLTNESVLRPVLESLNPYPDLADPTIDSQMKQLRMAIAIGKAKDGPGIAISYRHSDRNMAQSVATLLIVKLQEDNLKRREGLIETTTEFLSTELGRLKGELETKEQEISDFKKSHIGELPDQREAYLRTLDRLQIDFTTSSEALNKAGERLTALEKAIREFSDLGETDETLVERSGRMGTSPPPDPRLARLAQLKQQLNELMGMYKENYPDVVHLREEIHLLELDLRSPSSRESVVAEPDNRRVENGGRVVQKRIDPFMRELTKERNEVKSEMAFLKDKQANTVRQIKELELHVQRIPVTEQRLAVLVRDYDNLQKGYQSLLDKRTNATIVENYESRKFGEQYRIIEAANLPIREEPPTLIHFLLGGLVLGCAFGFGGVIGLELLKPGFRRPEEIESYLGLPVFASIPPFEKGMVEIGLTRSRVLLAGPTADNGAAEHVPAKNSYYEFRKKSRDGHSGKKAATQRAESQTGHLIARWGSHSVVAEQYRVASTRLLLQTAEKKNVVTLVASSIMGEGKTTTAVNLAYILAHDLRKSTLLIDCDFKRPMVHEYMDIVFKPGLSEAIHGKDVLENCIHPYDGIPLSILPCGDPRDRPTSISGIQYVKQILPELKIRYDHLILDGPPVLTLADVNILSSMADRVIFVVRAGLTSQEMVRTAVKQLNVDGDGIGVVLTQVEMEFTPYLMYHKDYAAKNR